AWSARAALPAAASRRAGSVPARCPPGFPADKRTLNQFRRFTGRAEGLSISFEAHLLGSRIEYDEERDTLRISSLPTQLRDQLKRRKAEQESTS
ncbi:nucleoid-associated protein, partial [Pseudomonas aeruginosa]|nr:nucleoid-associated protein [Pseudomonas aeruginosa]